MANQKDLMKLSVNELIALGSQSGLTFHAGMKKSHMVQQLSASAASGWLDTNAELMGGSFEDDSLITESLGDSSMISDAAHIAQVLSSAGYTEAFHAAMNGPTHHVEAVHAYMERLGVNTDDVWMHMPKPNPNLPQGSFNMLNAYMRDTLAGHQDIMPELPGHYTGDIMGEYSTNRGDIAKSMGYLAHMYVDRQQYDDPDRYARDVYRVAKRLESELPQNFREVAAVSAMNVGNKSGPRVSYMDSLPQLGSESIVGDIQHPRQPLNASGLPLGSMGSGIKAEYSLSASLSGSPGWSDASKSLYQDVSGAVKSAAKVYAGGSERGMNAYRTQSSDRDLILDSASRYTDLADARSGYDNLKKDIGDDPRYSGASIRGVLENAHQYNEAEISKTFDPAERLRNTGPTELSTSNEFTANLNEPTSWNSARDRRESIAIANLDSASVGQHSSVKYHDALEQGTQEWLDFRKQYDITGSTIGDYLGHNPATNNSPIHTMGEKIGLTVRKDSPRARENFERGHRLEAWARPRVGERYGIEITETGAITNDDYPGMMYSPDGLIGDDALWEHKAPNNFKDLETTPNYMDQMQLGMHLSGRSRTLFTQTVGEESRSQWVEADPTWFERNKNKIISSQARMNAGREFMESSDLEGKDLVNETRKVMSGDGIWGYQTRDHREGEGYTAGKRGMAKYSAAAGTAADPFIGSHSPYNPEASRSGYQPNFVMHEQNFPATTGNGDTGNDSMALSVKKGILAAQEENKQKGIGADADFDGKADSMGWNQERFDAANGGGSGGGGGRGGYFTSGGNYFDDYGRMGGSLAAGIAGGSIGSATNGVMQALMATPAGRMAAVGIGAIQIGNEAAEYMNDFIGNSLDAGVMNPNEYSSMSQGLEMLGLNSQQAARMNQTTHSAYNTMLNGDPSAAVNIVRGSRGLLTIGDIRSTGGDPVALARIMQERGKERGWSQARIAGAAQMAGLDGMARAFDRTEYSHERAGSVVESGRNSDFAEGMAQSEMLQVERAQLLPGYNVPQSVLSHGAALFEAGSTAAGAANSGYSQARQVAANVYDFIAGEESGGKEYNKDGTRVTSPTGARGIMQVLPSTARDPGYGIKPSDGSPEDDARVGREYYDAMYKRFGGDHEKAMAAYTDGAGTVDKAVDKFGMDWLSAVPAQAQKRVKAFREWSKSSQSLEEGATGFTRNGMSYGQTQTVVNVKIDAKVNNQVASATVAVPGGQTVTQQMNMNNGAQQRR
ncbi:putative tail fiber [Escherichia phage phiEcoM-GJ1]|uniref:Putative tail fiber n=1 Tax=Escherichia phage phiEcoM-GJ1 TaxID=451705 RepID=A9Q1W5_9CAUD|nr:virion structural protein [Escherichia phage phiEcoM-GJ1]ABR68774.1 putative tail fiber [Escherichia phage phiEcoM-GJ1]